jgi:hypothetical protein
VLAVAGLRKGDHRVSPNPREGLEAPPDPTPGAIREPFETIGAGTTGTVGASVASCARACANEHNPTTTVR